MLVASEPVRQGAQVLLSYGDKGNDELLQLFGFVKECNPHDTFLSIGLAEFLSAPSSGLFASEAAAQNRLMRVRALGLRARAHRAARVCTRTAPQRPGSSGSRNSR